MKVYLAGPVTGFPDGNFPAFNTAAHTLRRQGHTVFNPAETDFNLEIVPTGKDSEILRQVFLEEFNWLIQNADAIVMLPGWENSKGAQAEWAMARALGLKISYL